LHRKYVESDFLRKREKLAKNVRVGVNGEKNLFWGETKLFELMTKKVVEIFCLENGKYFLKIGNFFG